MRSMRRWFYMLAAAQAIFLLGWAGWLELELSRLPTVLLDVRPVDPAEILRGDYIWLRYVISDVPKSAFPSPPGSDVHGNVACVELAPKEEFWEVASASVGECAGDAAPIRDRLRVEGRIDGWEGDSVTLDYGIDRYYVPEGMGTPRGKLTVRAAVTSWHRALIKEVYLDGRPYP